MKITKPGVPKRADGGLAPENRQETGAKPRRRRGPGRPFQPGQSGNPSTRFQSGVSGNAGGRPKGSKTFAVREYVAEAITDPETRRRAIEQLKANLAGRRSVVPALEFAARINREIGLGSDQQE